MPNKAPPERQANVMHDISIAFIIRSLWLGKSRCRPSREQYSDARLSSFRLDSCDLGKTREFLNLCLDEN
jgi:hypothetical protein